MYILRQLYTYIHTDTSLSMYIHRQREMEEYLRRCEKMGERAAMMMEFRGGNGALRTTMAIGVRSFSSSKRKKSVDTHEDDDLNVDLQENSVSPATSAKSVRAPSTSKCSNARCKSREVVKDILRSLDLQDEDFETDNSAHIQGSFSRETTPTNELRGDAVAEMESPSTAEKKSPEVNPRRKLPAGNKPPTSEIEEFFAVAEKYEQKRFQEKYNYDIVKDMPLEGRYQWVCLKP